MKSLATTLKKLFSGDLTEPARRLLPDDVRVAFDEKKLATIQDYLQSILRSNPNAPELASVLAEARTRRWSPKEVAKLEAFGHYYAGDLTQAFNRARPYAEGPDFDPDLFVVAVFSLYYVGQYEDAYCLLSLVTEQDRYFAVRADFHIVKALICWATNHLDEVGPAIGRACTIEPDNSVAALNALAMYFELGEQEAFEAVQQEIASGKHRSEQVGFAQAVVELAQGRYAEGFSLMELRYRLQEAGRYLNPGLFDKPRWQGEKLDGRTLLVSAEQGIGDTVMMARYLSQLQELGGNIVMETQPETLPLLIHNFPDITMLAREYAKAPTVHWDVWIGTMSLPFVFGSTPENIPCRENYLEVPHDILVYWQQRVDELARPGCLLRVGLAWSGSPTHRADRRRSIPFAQMAAAIRMIADVDFFAIQTKVPEVRPTNLIDVSDEMITLADTAALIASMDLVITVDTSAVHVAGAIGKEAWLLLPYRYEWRWGIEGEGNNWYDSVRVIRQNKGGEWAAVLEEVFGRRLLERISSLGRVKDGFVG